MQEIIKFHDTELVGIEEDGTVMIPIRPICEAIGLHVNENSLKSS